MTENVRIKEKRGNWSKKSSPVFVVEIEKTESDELTEFFGKVDEVKRTIEYHRQ